jgi:hypothetical protein
MSLMISILYYASPNVRHPGFRWITPGSVLAVLLWIVASAAFAFYVASFASYNKTYGALGGIVVFLVWLWITNTVILLGAELNAEIERGRQIQTVLSGAQKAVAFAQGPLHALRGTGEEEKQLKNAKTEYASEAEEIATYAAIETLAGVLGDKETQRLARTIGREEERMRSFSRERDRAANQGCGQSGDTRLATQKRSSHQESLKQESLQRYEQNLAWLISGLEKRLAVGGRACPWLADSGATCFTFSIRSSFLCPAVFPARKFVASSSPRSPTRPQ